MVPQLPAITLPKTKGFRLINTRLPPIDIFNDVADADEFQDLFDLQALTNPRLRQEVGSLNYIDLNEIPWGIPGCHYAAAPFTHVAPEGSRFSTGDFGMLYIADTNNHAMVNTICTKVVTQPYVNTSGRSDVRYSATAPP